MFPDESRFQTDRETMSSDAAKPTIMVVDDFPSTLMVLETMLRHANYNVRTFSSGLEAVKAAGEILPDLILLDVQMPDMDGYEVCSQLKANPRLALIPVLFLSAADEAMDKVKAFNCGAADYLTKPYHPGEILSRVGVQMQVRRLQDELDALRESRDVARLKELEELMEEFNGILIKSGRSPVTTLTNCLGSLKSQASGKLGPDEMTSLDGAMACTAQISHIFQKCLKAVSSRARTKKT
jgi:PleD family two-component response regulator